ncbi:uncharacterized protein LOC127795717 [Diospyros lotus]|uniref:uncharacterized protein LOC127795717 n=1 Tax=Diospyros lotus TaxID=55363 RepID=UPI00224CD088|nr:uncharacterized protein LOC127795717 [Diospyros lotus]
MGSMGSSSCNYLQYYFSTVNNVFLHLLLCSSLIITFNVTSASSSSHQLTLSTLQRDAAAVDDDDVVCENKDCGQGTCFATNTSVLGFDCDCHHGWKKMQLGPLTFPSCVIPNCTLDFQCGNGAPPPPPPPPPPLNLTSPCNFVWCGDGNCIVNGTGHYCQCNDGSANLFNMTSTACFKQCSFGLDCNSLGLGSDPPPPPTNSASPTKHDDAANSSKNLRALAVLALSASFLTWI